MKICRRADVEEIGEMNCCICTTLHGDPEETPCEHAIGRPFSDCTCVESGRDHGRPAIIVHASQSCAVLIMKPSYLISLKSIAILSLVAT
jgi:hypothetical protein